MAERLTFEGNFCDIAKCREQRWGKYCPDGACSQRKVWERLKEYEDAVPQWISVKDRLPEADENPVLAGNAELGIVNMAWYHHKNKRWEWPSGFCAEVTHWMPRSSLPRMDGAE